MKNPIPSHGMNLKSDLIVHAYNYLEEPLISLYLSCNEVLSTYLSIKHVDTKRDFYPVVVSNFLEFMDIAEKYGTDILESSVFRLNRIAESAGRKRSQKIIELVDPDGFKLLDVTDPVTLPSLKKAYRKAVFKNHPDRGGSTDLMVKINAAYSTFHAVICSYSGDENEVSGALKSNAMAAINVLLSKSHDYSKFPISSDDYIYILKSTLAEIYCDTWDLDRAYNSVKNLVNSSLIFGKTANSFNEQLKLITTISNLSKKMSAANMDKEAGELLQYAKVVFKELYGLNRENNLSYVMETFILNPEKIISKNKKYRVIVSHESQIENAFRFGVITEDKYRRANELAEIFRKEEQELQRRIEKFVSTQGFITHLPADLDPIESREVDRYVPEINYTDDKKLSALTPEQKSEYFLAFSSSSTLALLRKYTYVRLASYMLSLNPELNDSLVLGVLAEISLFLTIYSQPKRKNAKTENLLMAMRLDFGELSRLANGERGQKIISMQDRYAFLLYDVLSSDYAVEIGVL